VDSQPGGTRMSTSGITSCTEPPDPCDELRQQILEFIQNLQKRYWDLRNDIGNLPATPPAQPDPRYGTRSIEGERHQFRGRQQGLRNRLDDYNSKNCGDPPPGAWDWATREVPVADPKPVQPPAVDVKRVAEAAAKTGATIGAGYVAYRIIRMIPSLFPPLWWTIPENAVIP
jgi:hypothetical protein